MNKKRTKAVWRWVLVIAMISGLVAPSLAWAQVADIALEFESVEQMLPIAQQTEPELETEIEDANFEDPETDPEDICLALQEAVDDEKIVDMPYPKAVSILQADATHQITFHAMHVPNGTLFDELNANGGFWRSDLALTGAARNADFLIVKRLMTDGYGMLDALPVDPVHMTEGYTFAGWVLADGTPVTLATEFDSDTTVYAGWDRTWSDFDSLRFNRYAAPIRVSGGDLEIDTYFIASYVANPFVTGAAGPFNTAAANLGVHGMSIRVPVYVNGEPLTAAQLRDAPILVLNPWGGDTGVAHNAAQGGVPAVNTLAGDALRQGWIVVHHGMRGHSVAEAGVADTENFQNFGKVPHPIVDSKAVLRYLHWNINEGNMPWGDAERIFVQGHSSGGSAVSMLGASGNTVIFEEQMELIGALPLSMSGVYDHIFGAISVNPVQIRNWGEPAHAWELYQNYMHLTHAPGAYIHPLNAALANEWVRIMNDYLSGMTAVNASALIPTGTPLTPENYTQYLLGFIRESIIRELNIISEHGLVGRPGVPATEAFVPLRGRSAIEAYLTLDKPADGTYATRPMPFDFLNPVFCTENPNIVVDVNNSWEEFVRHIWGACAHCQTGPGSSPCERTGQPGAPWCQVNPLQLMQFRFDRPMTAQTIQPNGVVLSMHTNDGYGDDLNVVPGQRPGNLNRPVNTASARSFGIPNDFITIYSDIGWYWIGNHRNAHSAGALPNIEVSEEMRALLTFQRNAVDPMYFILNADRLNVDIADHWHIRNGTRDISPGRATVLAQVTTLENAGHNVNFEFTWNIGHSVAALTNDLPEMWAWADYAMDFVALPPPPVCDDCGQPEEDCACEEPTDTNAAAVHAAIALIDAASPIARIEIAGGVNATVVARAAALEEYLNNLVGMDVLGVTVTVESLRIADGRWVVSVTKDPIVGGTAVLATFVAPTLPPTGGTGGTGGIGGGQGGQAQQQQLPPAQVPLADYDGDVAQAIANINEQNSGTSVVVSGVSGAIAAQLPEGSEGLTLVNIALPAGAARQATAMAILNDDLSFTAIPARFNADGSVTVIIAESVTLVALSVASSFTDIDHLLQHVQDEIGTAAARMIVQGVGNNRFDPTRSVLTSEAVAMFMRAMGMSADMEVPAVSGVNQEAWFAIYFNTAVANELISGNVNPTVPMTRIQAAALLENALEVFGMRPELTEAEIDALLSDFSDLQDLSQAQRETLAVTVYHGIFRGHVGGIMGANDQLTRSQMASLAVRFQSLILDA
ncbi:MAG: InlB B-repeat-containing protein [Oscillospiraceae bacterium]|nr:InlB B-repeat-containing protein [Oscillospiraceae bacterium]